MIELNPGIRRVVGWLNDMGFVTTDSGDGETHDFECDRLYPYVVIKVEDPAMLAGRARALRKLLENNGIEVYPQGLDDNVCIQATYDPVNNLAFLDVMNLTDDMLPENLENGSDRWEFEVHKNPEEARFQWSVDIYHEGVHYREVEHHTREGACARAASVVANHYVDSEDE